MIEIIPLGAGNEVGRSCILVSMNEKHFILDCGVHMGFKDKRMYPDFSRIDSLPRKIRSVEFICISHFHMDHLAGLPYFTEKYGFKGKIFMSYPTKAMAKLLLEDFLKLQKMYITSDLLYTEKDIEKCLKKVTCLNLKQTYTYNGFQITIYNAGHVIGASMFNIKRGKDSVFYTGDFSMTSDRHLSSASCPKLKSTVFITESTYGNMIRNSRLDREREFVYSIYDCLKSGGNVLVPVFALGRCQELSLLLNSYWNNLNLKYPIYISGFLGEISNFYYSQYISWCNESLQETFYKEDYFSNKRMKKFQKEYLYDDNPKVVFASPGMLHSGLSLEIFETWCVNSKNLVIFPGYCVEGTIGNEVIKGNRKIKINGRCVRVHCQIKYLSFSAHSDAYGLMKLITQNESENVVLVHGSETSMIQTSELLNALHPEIHCFMPKNNESVKINLTE